VGHGAPSDKKLWGHIFEARALIGEEKWRAADLESLNANWEDLEAIFGDDPTIDATTPEGRLQILKAVASEIAAKDYAGPGRQPPERSTKSGTLGKELMPFCWRSAFFGNELMYFKFCFSGTDKDRRVCIHSLHKSKKRNRVNGN